MEEKGGLLAEGLLAREEGAGQPSMVISRRAFCGQMVGGVALGVLGGCGRRGPELVEVNDVCAGLTPTEVRRVLRPRTHDEVIRVLRRALHHNAGLSVAGGRHSTGRQGFGTGTIHFDLRELTAVGDLDRGLGLVQVSAGCAWPQLMAELDRRQAGEALPWSIRQKQTGADELTLGGALACNMHGAGLGYAPMVQDVEGFDLLTAEGEEIRCSRERHADWFRLALGGYGLFGVVTGLTLRLRRRSMLRRRVEWVNASEVSARVAERMKEGAEYGEFEMSPAEGTEAFLRTGILVTYGPTGEGGEEVKRESPEFGRWREVEEMVRSQPNEAFRAYGEAVRRTEGERLASDRLQLRPWSVGYHELVARAMREEPGRCLVRMEVFVPHDRLEVFLDSAREDFRNRGIRLGSVLVRWVERDQETFLPWARGSLAGVTLKLIAERSESGLARAGNDVRVLLDRALEEGGSFYLAHGIEAVREQVLRAYPELPEFLGEKERRDRHLVWRSDWFTKYARQLA